MIKPGRTRCYPHSLASSWLKTFKTLEGDGLQHEPTPGLHLGTRKTRVHQVEGRLFEWRLPAKALKRFPAKRKLSKGHVPSPAESAPEDMPARLLEAQGPQQMFGRRWGGCPTDPVTAFVRGSFQILVSKWVLFCVANEAVFFLALEEHRFVQCLNFLKIHIRATNHFLRLSILFYLLLSSLFRGFKSQDSQQLFTTDQ